MSNVIKRRIMLNKDILDAPEKDFGAAITTYKKRFKDKSLRKNISYLYVDLRNHGGDSLAAVDKAVIVENFEDYLKRESGQEYEIILVEKCNL